MTYALLLQMHFSNPCTNTSGSIYLLIAAFVGFVIAGTYQSVLDTGPPDLGPLDVSGL